MSLVPSWFRRKGDQARERVPANWEEELAALEEEADSATLAFQGTPLNRAGDLCLRAGDHDRALTYYGRAIDVLLEDGQREAARGVANKIIRIHPEAVRTLCTLTWLDLASGHKATAMMHLRDYVAAAQRSGNEHLARDQILEMARVVSDEELVTAAADALDQLGYGERAADVREWAAAGAPPGAITDEQAFIEHCLKSATTAQQRPRDDA